MPTAGGVLRPICSVSVSSSERVDVHTPHLCIAFSITGASRKGLCFQSISCKVECVVQKGWLGMSSSNIGSWGKEHVMCICTVCHTVQWLLSHSWLGHSFHLKALHLWLRACFWSLFLKLLLTEIWCTSIHQRGASVMGYLHPSDCDCMGQSGLPLSSWESGTCCCCINSLAVTEGRWSSLPLYNISAASDRAHLSIFRKVVCSVKV